MLALNICRAGAAAVLAGLAVIPPDRLADTPSVCVFKAVFGVECLGCGMTRAICSALHGDIGAAMAYNALVVMVLPALAAFVFTPARKITQCVARRRPLGPEAALKNIAGRAAVT